MKYYTALTGSIVLFLAPFVLYYFDLISFSEYKLVGGVKIPVQPLLLLSGPLWVSALLLAAYWMVSILGFVYLVQNFKFKTSDPVVVTNEKIENLVLKRSPWMLLCFYISFFMICLPLGYFISDVIKSSVEQYGFRAGPWGIRGAEAVHIYYMFLIVGLTSLLGALFLSWLTIRNNWKEYRAHFYLLGASFSISYIVGMISYISVASRYSEIYIYPFIIFISFFVGGGVMYFLGKLFISLRKIFTN